MLPQFPVSNLVDRHWASLLLTQQGIQPWGQKRGPYSTLEKGQGQHLANHLIVPKLQTCNIRRKLKLQLKDMVRNYT